MMISDGDFGYLFLMMTSDDEELRSFMMVISNGDMMMIYDENSLKTC